MNTIRERLDPSNTLPHVTLETYGSHDFGHLTRDQIHIVEGDKVVGKCDIVGEMNDQAQFAHFDGIELFDQENRGRGVGLATYALAIELAHSRGLDFQTQNTGLTIHSKRVWEHLAAKAVAVVDVPFEPTRPIRGSDRFVGKYRVPLP